MKSTSLRANPAAPSASRIQSSMGRPITGTSALGTSSVSGPRRLPRPAPITMGRMLPDEYHKFRVRGAGAPTASGSWIWARDLRHATARVRAMATPDDLTIGIVTDRHFGAQALYEGKLR